MDAGADVCPLVEKAMSDEQIAESSPANPDSSESSPEDVMYEDGPVVEAEPKPKGEGDSEAEAESEPESEPGSAEPTDDERKSRSERDRKRNEERYQRLLEERSTYKAERDALQRQLEQFSKKPEATQQPNQPQTPTGAPKRPRYEDFKTMREYEDAESKYHEDVVKYAERMAEERVQKTLEAERAREREEAVNRARFEYQSKIDKRFNEELSSLAKLDNYRDIEDVLDRIRELPDEQKFSQPMLAFFGENDHGARVAHYLGKNDGERLRINGLPLGRQIQELTLLHERLKPRKAPEQRKKPDKNPSDLGTNASGPIDSVDPWDVMYGKTG